MILQMAFRAYRDRYGMFAPEAYKLARLLVTTKQRRTIHELWLWWQRIDALERLPL